jgi:hypothetical protein
MDVIPIQPVMRARIKFFARNPRRCAAGDRYRLAGLPDGWSCNSDEVVAAFDADFRALDGNLALE